MDFLLNKFGALLNDSLENSCRAFARNMGCCFESFKTFESLSNSKLFQQDRDE